MPPRFQQRINQSARVLVWISWVFLYLVVAPPFDYNYKDSGAWGLYARLVGIWLAVPGLLVSVMTTWRLYRLLGWGGWAVIAFVCYNAYREMHDAGALPF